MRTRIATNIPRVPSLRRQGSLYLMALVGSCFSHVFHRSVPSARYSFALFFVLLLEDNEGGVQLPCFLELHTRYSRRIGYGVRQDCQRLPRDSYTKSITKDIPLDPELQRIRSETACLDQICIANPRLTHATHTHTLRSQHPGDALREPLSSG